MDTVDRWEVAGSLRRMTRKSRAVALLLMEGMSRRKARAKLGIFVSQMATALKEIKEVLTAAGFAEDFSEDQQNRRTFVPPRGLWKHAKPHGGFARGKHFGLTY